MLDPIQKFSNVDLIRPLVRAMTHCNPDARPDASAVLQQWQEIRGRIFTFQRGWRLRTRKEIIAEMIVLDVIWVLRLALVLSRRFRRYIMHLAVLFIALF